MLNLLALTISEETAALIMQYAFYGGIFLVGLIVLSIMNRAAKKPVSGIAIEKTKKAIKNVDKLLEEQEKNKLSQYTLPGKIMQLSSEIGDLEVLADREFTQNKNITYEALVSCYQKILAKLSELNMNWNQETATKVLTDVKTDLENALELLNQR